MAASDHHALQTPTAPTGLAVREMRQDDAEELLRLQHRLDEETTMMMLEPGERRSDLDDARSHVQETLASTNSTIIVAESNGRIVGYVEAEGGRYRRIRHTAHVVIGVLRSHQGRGIGRALLAALRSWAVDHGVSRLELTVRADNEPARRLYERAGFVVEGMRRESLRADGEMIDELAMAHLLEGQHPSPPAADELRVRVLRPDEHPWLEQELNRRWGSTQLVSRGRAHNASKLPAFVCQAAERLSASPRSIFMTGNASW